MIKSRVTLLLAALALVVVSCTPPKPESCATQQRMITKAVDFDVESEIVRAMEEAGALQVVRKFEFKDDKIIEELKKGAVRIADLRVEDGFLKFRTTGNDPWITLPPVNIYSQEVNVVAVRAAIGNSFGRLTDRFDILFATESDSRFHGALMADVRTDGALKKILLFTDPGRVPEWKGVITKLRLDPVFTANQEVAIQDISLLKINRDVDFNSLDILPQRVGRTWTDQLLQNIVFSRFSEPLEWSLSLPCKPEFHARVALPDVYHFLDWRTFQALLEVKDKTGPWSEAARLSIDKSEGDKVYEGIPFRASLDKWAGHGVTVRLRIVEDGSDTSPSGLVYWVDPYVTSKRRVENQPNIILISIDTLRPDHLSLYGYRRRTSPNLDEWAKKGVVFKNAFSHSPWTLPSHASIFTSVYPSQHQAMFRNFMVIDIGHDYVRLSEVFNTLSERFQDVGYITAGFAGAGPASWESNLDQGFDLWFQPFEFGRDFSRVTEWLDQNTSARFFLFLHTYEVHDYASRNHIDEARQRARKFYPDYKGRLLSGKFSIRDMRGVDDGDIDFLQAMYDGQILAVDRGLRRLFEELANRGLEENTVVVFTSDHGEEFNDHGKFGHAHSLYDELLHVPLIIRYPRKLQEGGVMNPLVRLVDIYPTILELAEVPVPDGIEGRSLVPLMRGEEEDSPRVLFNEEPMNLLSGVRTPTSKLINVGPKKLTFDLTKDPLEQHPESPPPDLQRLEALHDDFEDKHGGYHFLVGDPRLDGCPIQLTTEGTFINLVPRSTEPADALRLEDKEKRITAVLDLKDGDRDGFHFLVFPDSASVKVELCRGDRKDLDGLAVSFGSNGTRNVGSSWTLGKDIGWEEIRVRNSPVGPNGDFPGGVALWKLETRSNGGEAASELTDEQKNEHMRRLRSLGYVE